jgi:hypothetical protein
MDIAAARLALAWFHMPLLRSLAIDVLSLTIWLSGSWLVQVT